MVNELVGIKNIIFDLGGVILNIDYQRTIQEFKKLGVSNFETIFSQYQQSDISDKFEIGEISGEEFYQEIKEMAQVDFSYLQFKYAWNAMLLDLPKERIEVLNKLKNKYRLFLFSNTNAIHFNEFVGIVKTDFDSIFEKTYYSHQFGRRKPDASSFEALLEKNNLNKEETLFIDDSSQHIESANKIGLKTIFIKDKTINQIFI